MCHLNFRLSTSPNWVKRCSKMLPQQCFRTSTTGTSSKQLLFWIFSSLDDSWSTNAIWYCQKAGLHSANLEVVRLSHSSSFVSFTKQSFQPDIIEWNTQTAGQLGSILELTLQPAMRADEIPNEFYDVFASFMRRMNSQYGVPIFIRFMHEMNGKAVRLDRQGYWLPYGRQPGAHITAFRLLTEAIRRKTNMTGSYQDF